MEQNLTYNTLKQTECATDTIFIRGSLQLITCMNTHNLFVFQSKTRKGGGHGPDGFEGYDAAGGKVRMEPSWWQGKKIFDDFCMWG